MTGSAASMTCWPTSMNSVPTPFSLTTCGVFVSSSTWSMASLHCSMIFGPKAFSARIEASRTAAPLTSCERAT